MTIAHGHTPWIKQPLFWLLLAIFTAVFIPRGTLKPEPDQAMDNSRGYKAAVDRLASRQCLKLDQESKEKRIIFAGQKTGCPSKEQFTAYVKATFLSGDMAGLIEQRWQFDSEGKPSAIRANAHRLRFAGGERSIWGGSILYAPGAGPTPGLTWGRAANLGQNPLGCNDKRELNQYDICGNNGNTLWQRVERIQAISERPGSAPRVREPTLASVAQRLELPGMEGSVDSSIRYTLHFAVQAELEGHLEKAKNGLYKNEKTVRAGVLLMDGLTGEIHAAATHPAKQEDIGTGDSAQWLTKNWNFERLEIGSTAKIPFAAAIAQANTDLLKSGPKKSWKPGFCGAEENCRNRASEGLGLTFQSFIAKSSNGHALWLLDQARKNRALGWDDNLRAFACIEPMQGKSAAGCDGQLWTNPGGTRAGEAEPLLQLDMGHARRGNLYAEYYINILGGMRSRWTSANLAQAYARIFSDRPINPRMTIGDDTVQTALGIKPQVWRNIRDGMAAVVKAKGGGTGHLLCESIVCTNDNQYGNIWLYAKTGTATISNKAGDDSKTLVIMAITPKGKGRPESPEDIKAMKIIVITQRYNASGTSAIDLAIKLFSNARFKEWLQAGVSKQ